MATKNTDRMRFVRLIIASVACASAGSRATADDPPVPPAGAELQRKMQKALEARAAERAARRVLIDAKERLAGPGPAAAVDCEREFDNAEVARDQVDPPMRQLVAVNYFEQLVFGSAGANAVASHRNRLDLSLRAKVGALHLACGLSHSQTRKIELAGKGDIQRLFDRIDSRKQEYILVRDEEADAALREMMKEIMTIQPALRSPFGEGSLFAKTLKHTLSSEQLADFELSHAIELLGGRIMLRSHGADEIKTMRMNAKAFADDRLSPWKGWGTLRGLSLESSQVVDADLARIRNLGKLELLDLGATRITGDGLVHLQDLRELKFLDLRRTQVADAGLAHLSQLTNLKTLHLGSTLVTGAGLVHLRSLKNLESLFVYQTPVTDGDLIPLAELDKLQELGLDGTQITDAGLVHLSGLSRLQTLAVSNTRLTDAGLVHLNKLKNLKTITVFGTKVSEAGAAELKRSLPGLKVIQ